MLDVLKQKLTQAGRILVDEDQGDTIFGHVTARYPDDPNRILMKPASIGLEEMTADNIITVDIEGEKVAGNMPRHLEVFIHTEIMRVRPDVQAVVHTHPMHATAFSSLGRPLVPVGHEGSLFCDGLPVFSETTDLIVDHARGRSVARTLGAHSALLLRNHGIVSVGRSIEEALCLALALERACAMQLLAEAAGGPKAVTSPEEAKVKKSRIGREEFFVQVFDYLTRQLPPRR